MKNDIMPVMATRNRIVIDADPTLNKAIKRAAVMEDQSMREFTMYAWALRSPELQPLIANELNMTLDELQDYVRSLRA